MLLETDEDRTKTMYREAQKNSNTLRPLDVISRAVSYSGIS